VGVPDRYLRAALGVFAATVGIYGILNPVLHRTISALWAIPSGIVGGAIATIFGAGGPIYATYLSGRLRDKSEIRSTLSTLISISAFTRAVVYALTGLLLHLPILAGIVVLAPFAWMGLKLGSRIHVGLTQEQMRRAVGALLVLTGSSLLARVLL
ncbi:MAG: TSUP family transporter, partial [Usitatibacter sp.]